MMPEFLRYLKKRNEAEQFAVAAWQFLDEPNCTEGLAKYEATLWHDCIEHFEREITAYNRLADLQGKLVPRMLANISLSSIQLVTMPREAASYFDVKGILLERIDGYCLGDLTLSPLPSNLRIWQQIIQSAVDAAHEINKRGIIMKDCAPRNVVVDEQSNTPRIVDLAQCRFRDKLVKRGYKNGWNEDEGWDPDVEYWEQVGTASNAAAIGAVMVMGIQNITGVKLDVEYPDYEAIIAEGTVPRNTVKAYKPKQQEWKDWCSKNWDPIPKDWGSRIKKQRKRRLDGAVAVEHAAAAKRQRRDEGETIQVATSPGPVVVATEFAEDDDDEPLIAAPALELAYKSNSKDWYDIKVLRRSAKESTKELSAQTANAWTSQLYAACGIKTSKVSHAPRVAAAQNADMDGVSEGQIRRAGRWNSGDQMTSCYLTSLPFEFMRSIADFDPAAISASYTYMAVS
ncbi:hypothetical protein VTI28DRAFT_10169 [Corynascus sepedonium]